MINAIGLVDNQVLFFYKCLLSRASRYTTLIKPTKIPATEFMDDAEVLQNSMYTDIFDYVCMKDHTAYNLVGPWLCSKVLGAEQRPVFHMALQSEFMHDKMITQYEFGAQAVLNTITEALKPYRQMAIRIEVTENCSAKRNTFVVRLTCV
tara:strand:+ start:44434 stop:44883 length:450 start_codon:yes stop_codon:yes gene_type:complete